MSTSKIQVLNSEQQEIALLNVTWSGDQYQGTIVLDNTPCETLALFKQFDEYVNTQCFSLVDDVEDAILAACPWVKFSNGQIAETTMLDVYPSTKNVVLKIRQPTETSVNGRPHVSPSIGTQTH